MLRATQACAECMALLRVYASCMHELSLLMGLSDFLQCGILAQFEAGWPGEKLW